MWPMKSQCWAALCSLGKGFWASMLVQIYFKIKNMDSGHRPPGFDLKLYNLLTVRYLWGNHQISSCLSFSHCKKGVIILPVLEVFCNIKYVNKYKMVVRKSGIDFIWKPISLMICLGIGRSNATSLLITRFVTLYISLHSSDFMFLISKMKWNEVKWIISTPVIS